MATTKKTTAKSSTKPRAAKADQSLAARTGRTVRDRPYTSAAIATGAVTAVAAAAAGAFFFSRRDKSFKEASEELSTLVKDGFTDASSKIKDLAERGSKRIGITDKDQADYAQQALMLKEKNKPATSPVDELAGDQIKAGAVAY